MLRDAVLFPGMVIAVSVARPRAIAAIGLAAEECSKIVAVTQRDPNSERLCKVDDVYQVGVLINVIHCLRLPNGSLKVAVEAEQRVDLLSFREVGDIWSAKVSPVAVTIRSKVDLDRACKRLMDLVPECQTFASRLGRELFGPIDLWGESSQFIDSILSAFVRRVADRQVLLELRDLTSRAEAALMLVESERDSLRAAVAALPLTG